MQTAKDLEIQQLKRALAIEAALEKVRTRTMTMHNSEELHETASVLFQQLAALGIEPAVCGFTILNRDNHLGDLYFSVKGKVFAQRTSFPHDLTKNTRKVYNEWISGSDFYTTVLEGKEQELENQKLDAYWQSNNVELFKDLTAFFDEQGIAKMRKKQVVHYAFFSHGYLHFSHFKSVDEVEVLKRFAKVFEQTYTRFLDLQKAEAQAREAQVETALERVRARTMAMHKSEELAEAGSVLFNQLAKIGIEAESSWISLIDPENDAMTIWTTHGEILGIPKKVFGADHPNFRAEIDAWKKKEVHLSLVMPKKNFLKSVKEVFDLDVKDRKDKSEFYGLLVRHRFGFLGFGTWDAATEEERSVYARFAKVFEQTYTRFLDLQKAEAQAREAQIEAALERVRAASMAMHKSEELKEVVAITFNQLINLNFKLDVCYIDLFVEGSKDLHIWSATKQQFYQQLVYVPYFDHPMFKKLIQIKKQSESFFSIELTKSQVRAFHDHLLEHTKFGKIVKPDRKAAILNSDGLTGSQAIAKHHGLMVYNFEGHTYSDTENDIIQRFSRVFEQAYVRFLDLEKAEEQARQLEIVFDENQRLLHSILPMPIAEQIRTGRKNVVKRFESVSILFADIVGFTAHAEKVSPQEVVDILNGLFSRFDDLTDQYGIEKIKTIGDAYMVAAGVPEEKEDHAIVLFNFAKEMLQTLQDYNKLKQTNLQLRIGISSGPVVAGVIGKKKFAYDLWGDTVNTAARMEAYGQENRIQISPTTYKILKVDFDFEKIPDVEIKGKGRMDVYLWK